MVSWLGPSFSSPKGKFIARLAVKNSQAIDTPYLEARETEIALLTVGVIHIGPVKEPVSAVLSAAISIT